MNIVQKLIKLAEDLENEGMLEEADNITDALDKTIPEHVDPQVPPVRTDNQPMYFEKANKSPVHEQISEASVANIGDDLIEGIIYMMAKKGEVSEDEKGLRIDDSAFVSELMNLL